jgi:hypothetical protein
MLNQPLLFAAMTLPTDPPLAQVSKQLPDCDLKTVMGGRSFPSPEQQNITLKEVLEWSLTYQDVYIKKGTVGTMVGYLVYDANRNR